MLGRTLVVGLCLLAAISPDLPSPNAPLVAGLPEKATAEGSVPAAAAGPLATPAGDLLPVRLLIPRIRVNALIEARGIDAGRNMLAPRDFHDVAWYKLGPTPGQPGNALINGHVSWWTGSAVFTRLAELRPGDVVIVVRGDGSSLSFKVTGRRTVTAAARVASLFAPSPVATLTLITCAGAWDPLTLSDTHRLLVRAVLV